MGSFCSTRENMYIYIYPFFFLQFNLFFHPTHACPTHSPRHYFACPLRPLRPFFFSPSNTIVRRSLLWMKHGYSWFLQFLGYFISDILCSASSNLQSGRNRLSFRQSPYFRGAGRTTEFTERERIQIYSGGSWKYYRKILIKVCR